MKLIEEKNFKQIVSESNSKSEVCKKLNIHNNGKNMNNVNLLIDKFKVDITHFKRKDKKDLQVKSCPVCNSKFEIKIGSKKEKTTCSISCSNTYFRSGVDNANYKDIGEYDKRSRTFALKYRKICFDNHEYKCVVCDENKILDVHHFDGDKFNNEPENLIPICATHHNYLHSKYKDEIIGKVIEYKNNFVKNIKLKSYEN